MSDMEKVIKDLEDIQKHLDTGYSFAICWKSKLIRDVLSLLKEREAVKPEPIMGTSISDCGKCRHAVAPGMNYCPVCGCRIDWN